MTTPSDNPPGSTQEQLPDEILTAIGGVLGKYLSTACHTATACEAAAYSHPDMADVLRQHASTLHGRCRLNQKFTGWLCVCGCHNDRQERPL